MSRSSLAEIAVIGAGVVGSAIAFRLAQAGLAVTIIEARYPGSGTSGNTFAWLNSMNKSPLAYHQLNVHGIDEHRDLAEEVDALDCLHLDGGLMWGTEADQQPFGQPLASQVEAVRSMGYLIEELRPDDARQLEPDLHIDDATVPVVFRMPKEGWLETTGLAHRLCAAATRRHRVKLIEGVRVTEFGKSNGHVTGVRLSDGSSIATDLVINATGPDAGVIATYAGATLPIDRIAGVNFVTNSTAVQLRHVVHAPGIIMRPDSATRVMMRRADLDSGLLEGQPVTVDDPRCSAALTAARLVVPQLKYASIESVRVGIRPIPRDGLPAVGLDAHVPGLYHAVTHSGVTLAALLGRLVCSDVLGDRPRELETFRPERFDALPADRVGSTEAGSAV